MKKLVTQILFLITINSFSQDSIKLQITKVRKSEDRTIYFMRALKKDTAYVIRTNGNGFIRVITRRRYITQCKCSGRKKGEWVSIARKDMIIEREVFRKKDLEN